MTAGSRFTTRPELHGNFGMVASTHWLASAVGMAALEHGGNAFDAAVAAGFALQVVEPHLNGPGGDMPAILWSAAQKRVVVVDGQGPAPRGASIDAARGLGIDAIPGNGVLPAVVPGAFAGWMLVLRDFGRLRLRDVLRPAIDLANEGFPVHQTMTDFIAEAMPYFLGDWRESAALYAPDGRPPEPGTRFRNPVLARTYERLLREAEAGGGGRDLEIETALRVFYEGFIAEAIDRFLASTPVLDSTGTRHQAWLTGGDLHGWRAATEEPVSLDYHDYTVYKTGPWGQGPVFLQQLALLRGFDLREMEFLGADHLHTVIECAKLAFADRDAYYADPRFTEVPLDRLLSQEYSDERRRLVGVLASGELRPGAHIGRLPASAIDGDTCHVDAIDREGNMISATPSGGWLQSSPAIPGLGFCLGTRGQMVSLDTSHPNALMPGKRPRTTLSPTLAFRAGEPYIAFGTPGGDRQDQWSLNFFLAHATFGRDLQAAVDAPNFYIQHFPSSFHPHAAYPRRVNIERRVAPATIAELERRGHDVVLLDDWEIGQVSVVARDSASGFLKAAASPRGMRGYAAGR